ncbi:hypothetical protein MLI34_19645 [Escherichia coli]|nr:hypothetical protein [Escherichia coli]
MINNAIALYSVDAEQAVLGCLMLNTDHDRTNAVFALLKPERFISMRIRLSTGRSKDYFKLINQLT